MRGVFLALIQEEETTGIEGAADAATQGLSETRRETETFLDDIGTIFSDARDAIISPETIAKMIVACLVVALGIIAYRTLIYGVPRVLRWRSRRREEPLDEESVAKIKRRDTAITLVRTALRYVVLIVVALLVVSIFLNDPIPAATGATVLAAILGFGAQSLLRDVIAGLSIVFEGQYAVGDFIEVSPPQGVTGIVEELGLRMTKIRSLSGEVSFIPNGAIQGITNHVSGRQRFNVEVQLSDADAAENVLKSLDEARELYLNPPRLAERSEADDGRIRLRIVAGVLPSMSWLVEEHLVERIKAAAGEEALAAEPLVYKIDQTNLRKVRDLLPQEAERNLPREADKKL
ncbi:MAG TPA: mechanosensitive ion channel family protein [Rubrobacter sp.]|jgi:small conductance mechanosensitive channel|nr:mechanosensitive ion channel family protein [Rubrobacter sp.]